MSENLDGIVGREVKENAVIPAENSLAGSADPPKRKRGRPRKSVETQLAVPPVVVSPSPEGERAPIQVSTPLLPIPVAVAPEVKPARKWYQYR